MGYLHIENLYKDQDILLFKECYAMEKIHGTSAHIFYKDGSLSFFSGGSKHEDFIKLFDYNKLKAYLDNMGIGDKSTYIYGEAYGGKCQRMSATYGNKLCFVAFEVRIGDTWLNVPEAKDICKNLGLDFVHYVKIPCTLQAINEQRDALSVQAIKNGIMEPKHREGVVLRPLKEVIRYYGGRIIAKYKRDEFRETTNRRNVGDKLILRTEVDDIVNEWVTEERLNHILGRGGIEERVENIGKIIALMIEDICRGGMGEIKTSKALDRAIGRKTALMFKQRLHNKMEDKCYQENIV
jgi:hypothetical protein